MYRGRGSIKEKLVVNMHHQVDKFQQRMDSISCFIITHLCHTILDWITFPHKTRVEPIAGGRNLKIRESNGEDTAIKRVPVRRFRRSGPWQMWKDPSCEGPFNFPGRVRHTQLHYRMSSCVTAYRNQD